VGERSPLSLRCHAFVNAQDGVFDDPGCSIAMLGVPTSGMSLATAKGMTITIDPQGRRFYLRGNTYPIKDRLRAAGCKWDADAKCWYTGKRELAEQLADQPQESAPQAAPSGQPDREAPGDDAIVAARATYKGQSYYVAGRVDRGRTHWDDRVSPVTTRDGAKALLYSRDGKLQFWAARDLVSVTKSYDKPQTISKLRRFAEKAKEARAQGHEDGIADGQRYECEECGEYVTRGQGTCWETGAAH